MFKFVSFVIICAASVWSSFAQNQQFLLNEQSILLPGETQWEYLLVRVNENNNGYDTSRLVENLESVKGKIDRNRQFGYTNGDVTYYSWYSDAESAQGALDSLGRAGWELVAVVPSGASEGNSNQSNAQFVLKRKYDPTRSRVEAEQRKLRQTQASGKTSAQAPIKKIEFIELDSTEAITSARTIENKAAARLEQALSSIKHISITSIKVRAYYQNNAEPRTQADIVVDGSRILLKEGNQYRASEAQTFLRQVGTDIFNKVGLRKSDVSNDFFYSSFNSNSDAPRVQIRISVIVASQGQSKIVAIGVVSGTWADVAVNK